jgi:hypothetical protein
MPTEFVRDAVATAAIFGFFGSVWFGWAQENPPRSWRPWLIAGAVLSLIIMVVGGILTWRHWNDGTVFDENTGQWFGIVVGVEFALAGIGAAILGTRGRKDVIPAWVAFVVGLHLFPVAIILATPMIHVVAALVTVAALAAVPVARSRSLPVSAATGLGAGAVLLAGASYFLLTAL